jgi:glycosyltransferase involved in cell wall biosynthesis
MIPTFNRSRYLAQTLESVLCQGFTPDEMQIEVVDNCSTQGDSEEVVKTIAPRRVSFYRQPHTVSISANWNTCIERARGNLVHILHDDDFVSEKFYREMGDLAARTQDCAFIASRSFLVDEDGLIIGVSGRVPQMEKPSRCVKFMPGGDYVPCAGVVIRRSFYEQFGGFSLQLVCVTNMEMWTRAVHFGGGILHPQPLASFRMHDDQDHNRNRRSAENVRDVLRLESFFCRYPGYSKGTLRAVAANWAFEQHRRFLARGDTEAALANAKFYAEIVPFPARVVRRAIDAALKVAQKVARRVPGTTSS